MAVPRALVEEVPGDRVAPAHPVHDVERDLDRLPALRDALDLPRHDVGAAARVGADDDLDGLLGLPGLPESEAAPQERCSGASNGKPAKKRAGHATPRDVVALRVSLPRRPRA